LTSIVVYGLSTEGYNLASSFALNGVPTTLVDENLHMAMQLKSEVVETHKTLDNLLSEETLIGLESMETVLNKASHVFFAPKIRRSSENIAGEINSRIREVAKHISQHSTFIFNLPVGLGGSTDILLLLEKVSGFNTGKDLGYIYAPMAPQSNTFTQLGFVDKIDKAFLNLLSSSGITTPNLSSLQISEILHAVGVISRHSQNATVLECFRRINASEDRIKLNKIIKPVDTFLDDLSSEVFDIKTILSSLNVNEPLSHLASGVVKSIDSYVRRLVEEVRNIMKIKDLKASKTKVLVNWHIDKYEIRGDRIKTKNNLVDRLKDYIGDISVITFLERELTNLQINDTLRDSKTSMIISCSKTDVSNLHKVLPKGKGLADCIFINANLPFEFYKTESVL